MTETPKYTEEQVAAIKDRILEALETVIDQN